MKLLLFLTFTLCAVKGMAQMPNPYGPSINLENAKKGAAPALAEARKNNWTTAAEPGPCAGGFKGLPDRQRHLDRTSRLSTGWTF